MFDAFVRPFVRRLVRIVPFRVGLGVRVGIVLVIRVVSVVVVVVVVVVYCEFSDVSPFCKEIGGSCRKDHRCNSSSGTP